MNISPVEGYTFAYYQSMQNIQVVTLAGGCNKYAIKYVGKLDAQNLIIVYADSNKNGRLTTKSTHIHNSKLASSKHHEDKALNNKREKSHAQGRIVSLTEMFHHMLQYSEVSTDLIYVDIATTPLEFRQSFNIEMIEKRNAQNGSTVEDGATIGNVCNNLRLSIVIHEWRNFTDNQLLIIKETQTLKVQKLIR